MGKQQHGKQHDRKKGGPSLFQLVVLGLAVAAVVKELRKDQDERTWHGTVAGFVPYEFRMPTVERFRERVWDPEAEHLLSPHVFGVGWTVNVGRVVELVRRKVDDAREDGAPA